MNHKKIALLLLLAASCTVTVSSAADDDLKDMRVEKSYKDWYLVRTDNIRNIKTWAKQEDGKRIRSFKLEVLIDGSLDAVARVHYDVENIKRWFWETKESRLLKKVSNTEYYYYQVYNAPLTVPDRDSVVHVSIEPYSAKKGFMMHRLRAAPDFMPPQKGLTRVLAQDMTIKFTPVGKDKTRLEAEGYIDPGGTIPAWTINFVQRSAPYVSMVGLQRMVQLPYYSEASDPPLFSITE
ncbi:MAG: START domain-containing protein [Fluviicoccus sp.]|uniref:START domain-containing protein n=1 Tax=Fluviicoccus sp. TaxID=2003552 RepID=UPI00271973BF|nr:START domain-containing protein [Fluviicoccus sp.]MDO8329548.1 START domain-containing protein [Fluviicoccus sp.]